MKKRWDIFCKVVDNFGDIGVCWRLARQLHAEHGLQIRLLVDDLEAAQAIIPNLNFSESHQVCDEISITKWDDKTDFSQAAEVVIETFSCGLPAVYLAAMVQQKSKWVNLEYLSAEPWVAEFHGKPSPQANGLIRYFYFPGFTEATGGLIRERDVEIRESSAQTDTLKISLFCYSNAPIHDLFSALQANIHAVAVYVPASSILPQIADFFAVDLIDVGDCLSRDNLHVHVLPFLSQADYDALLSDCDLNFVRGEDSWVRAIWAGKPFIWQPYFQDENTHIKKLEAFSDLFYANLNEKNILWKAHECWSAGQMPCDVLHDYLSNLNMLKTYTLQQSAQLTKLPDLATKLVDFCNKPVFTK
jgi:uncharacterized repeat protein (TIGR03837 family)